MAAATRRPDDQPEGDERGNVFLTTDPEWEHPERRSRRFYRLTPEGRTAFKTQRGEWNVFETAVAKILGETQ